MATDDGNSATEMATAARKCEAETSLAQAETKHKKNSQMVATTATKHKDSNDSNDKSKYYLAHGNTIAAPRARAENRNR
jgi:hypothetical protein